MFEIRKSKSRGIATSNGFPPVQVREKFMKDPSVVVVISVHGSRGSEVEILVLRSPEIILELRQGNPEEVFVQEIPEVVGAAAVVEILLEEFVKLFPLAEICIEEGSAQSCTRVSSRMQCLRTFGTLVWLLGYICR